MRGNSIDSRGTTYCESGAGSASKSWLPTTARAGLTAPSTNGSRDEQTMQSCSIETVSPALVYGTDANGRLYRMMYDTKRQSVAETTSLVLMRLTSMRHASPSMVFRHSIRASSFARRA